MIKTTLLAGVALIPMWNAHANFSRQARSQPLVLDTELKAAVKKGLKREYIDRMNSILAKSCFSDVDKATRIS